MYKGLNIGSAKISQEQKEGIPHHLIDILEPTESFEVDTFKKKVSELIISLNKRGKLPIIVGGTGLYMRALLFPYSLGQTAKSDATREKYQLLAKEKGNEYVHNLLKEIDEISANALHYNDLKRVIRALEIFEVSGTKKSDSKITNFESEYDYTLVSLTRNRETLYKTINSRVDEMFKNGLVEEVTNLVKEKGLTKDLQSMCGIGYQEFFPYFEGKQTLEEVKEKIKQDTRNYAKRQITWFKTMPNVHWFETDNGIEHVVEFLKTIYKTK